MKARQGDLARFLFLIVILRLSLHVIASPRTLAKLQVLHPSPH